jgi:drug/metabolite transporter (DMT)-like permease
MSSPRSEARGLALIASSTVAYGVQPIFGKVAYAAGVEPLSLLAWRYLIASLCLALLVRGPMPLRERLRLWAIGSIFVGNSVAYFMALRLLPASVNALIVFSFPIIVAPLAALTGVERPTFRSLIAATAAFAGCALTVGGLQLGRAVGSRRRLVVRDGRHLCRLRRDQQPLRTRRPRGCSRCTWCRSPR